MEKGRGPNTEASDPGTFKSQQGEQETTKEPETEDPKWWVGGNWKSREPHQPDEKGAKNSLESFRLHTAENVFTHQKCIHNHV